MDNDTYQLLSKTGFHEFEEWNILIHHKNIPSEYSQKEKSRYLKTLLRQILQYPLH